MPRSARKISHTGYYHIISRGINKQILFENAADYQKYLFFLRDCLSQFPIECVAYCLMENHVHLLLHDPDRNLGAFMKKLQGGYAQYFNFKYERVGHLFQERFHSEPVENEKYLLTVFLYILQNPEKAGIAPASSYRWNSYAEYQRPDSLTKTECIRSMAETAGSLDDLMKMYPTKKTEHLSYDFDTPRSAPVKTNTVLREILGTEDATVIQALPKEERDRIISLLKIRGLSVRTIERRTGVSRGIIQRIKT